MWSEVSWSTLTLIEATLWSEVSGASHRSAEATLWSEVSWAAGSAETTLIEATLWSEVSWASHRSAEATLWSEVSRASHRSAEATLIEVSRLHVLLPILELSFIFSEFRFIGSNFIIVFSERLFELAFDFVEELFSFWRFLQEILKLLPSFCLAKFVHQHLKHARIIFDHVSNLVGILTKNALKIFSATRNNSAENILNKFQSLT